MKVWRNAEGREFPQELHLATNEVCARVYSDCVPSITMVALGYELVEKEPVSFEVEAEEFYIESSMPGVRHIIHDLRLVPGKTYKVTEVVE